MNSDKNPDAYDMKAAKLLIMATLFAFPSCKTNSPKTPEIVRLYSLPPAIRVVKGAEIPTADGVIVIPADTLLHSHGSYMEQVERAIRP